MLNALAILFPVFALIAAGFVSRTTGVMGETAARELSRFVIWLALPALLFVIMAKSDLQTLWQADFIAVYILGSFAIFLLVLFWRLKSGVALADASVDGIAGAYSNTGYIGFPLMFLLFGSASEVPTAIASVIVVSVMFGFAVMLIETALHSALSWQKKMLAVFTSVLKNPLVLAPLAGVLFAMTPYDLPRPIDQFLTLLAGAASPAALVSLGLFLAGAWQAKSQGVSSVTDSLASAVTPAVRPVVMTSSARNTAIGLSFLKLVVQPILVAWLALVVFEMETQLALMAIVLAALPTGTGPYMLAEYYQRDALITAQTILISTVFSILSLTVLLHFLPIPA